MSFLSRSFSRFFAFGPAVAFLVTAASASDLEVRRTMAAPGELTAFLPPAAGARALVARLETPANASVSALLEWTPADREIHVHFASAAPPERSLASLKGRSPIILGTRTETGGTINLVLLDPSGGRESVAIRATINWSAASSSSPPPVARPTPREPLPAPAPAAIGADPVRLVEISWREDADLSFAALRRDGLTIRFSGPVHPEMARRAVRIEIGFPGRQPGLVAFEEVLFEARLLGDRLLLFPPQGLTLAGIFPARLTLDGDRLLGRNGLFVDADGSGLTLPSGDGRPGGLFRSVFRIVP